MAMSKETMEEIIKVLEQQQTIFDELLMKTQKQILFKKAAIQSNTDYMNQMGALDVPVPTSVMNISMKLEEEVSAAQEEIRSELETLLATAPFEEVEKLVKKTKFATRKPISGSTLLLNGKREIALRVNEETAEELVKLSPDRIVEIVKESKEPTVERFVEIYKPRVVEEKIATWIDANIKDEIYNLRCKAMYEEMKESIYTEDILEGIAQRWVHMGIQKEGTLTKDEMEKYKKTVEELKNIFINDKNITLL